MAQRFAIQSAQMRIDRDFALLTTKSKKHFVDGRTDARTYKQTDGRTSETHFIRSTHLRVDVKITTCRQTTGNRKRLWQFGRFKRNELNPVSNDDPTRPTLYRYWARVTDDCCRMICEVSKNIRDAA